MLLSEAIKLGSMLGPQLFGEAVNGTSSCALGAAALAAGYVQENDEELTHLHLPFPDLREKKTAVGLYLIEVIIRMNDFYRHSREYIADWIVENGYDCESVEATPVVTVNQEEVEVCC